MITLPSLSEMTQASVHLGHRLNKRHPKMLKYIQGSKNNINLIDLNKTIEKLEGVLTFIENLVARGGTIVLVGTKPAAKKIIKQYAEVVGMPYINERWLGGTLTNFSTISKLIDKLKKLTSDKERGEWQKYTKKERIVLEKELERLETMVGGLRNLNKLPEAIFVVDIMAEVTAVNEANKKKIVIIAMADTNTNPEKVTYPIPANDDATKSIELVVSLVAEAVKEGQKKLNTQSKKDEKN